MHARVPGARRTRPYSGERPRVHTAVEPGAWSCEERTEREREPQKMDGVGSFGAGRAGSTIDPIAFAKQPQTILRALSWVSTSGVFFFSLSPQCCCLRVMCVSVCVWWWWWRRLVEVGGGSCLLSLLPSPVTCSHCKYRGQTSSDY